MVDMTHDGDDRRAFFETCGIIFDLEGLEMGLILNLLLLEVITELEADLADHIVVEELVDGDHLPFEKEEFDDFRRRDVYRFGEVSNG